MLFPSVSDRWFFTFHFSLSKLAVDFLVSFGDVLVGFHLESVEAFAVDADDSALGDECLGVELVNDLEDEVALALACEDEEHLRFASAVESGGVDDCASAVGTGVDGVSDVLVAVGDDEELHALSRRVDHLVDNEGRDEEDDVAVDDALPVAEYDVGTGDDEQVDHQDESSEGNVFVLMDDGCDDVSTAGRTVAAQAQSDADAAEASAEHGSHERLVLEQMEVTHDFLEQREDDGEHEDAVDGFQAELQSQYFQCQEQQHGVDGEERGLHGYVRCPVEYAGNARHTTRCDVVGQEEDHPSDGVAHQSEHDDDVVVQLLVDF